MRIARHKTARSRYQLSRPVQRALEDGLIGDGVSVYDYGCGHGSDIRLLQKQGITCWGWDPIHRPGGQKRPGDVVNLGYVVNVIEDQRERDGVLREAWELARKLLVVSARLSYETKGTTLRPYGDGCLTQKGTFQKFYGQEELRLWIDQTLRVSSLAAAPGIFYVFREEADRQAFSARRYRRRPRAPTPSRSTQLFEAHRDVLEPLVSFMAERGRLPSQGELPESADIVERLGSIKRAARVIRQATGVEQWDAITEARSQDFLVYVALGRFAGRPKFSSLPADIQLDVKAFFSTYKKARREADALLFSAGDMKAVSAAVDHSPVGKRTPKAIYFHVSALGELPPVLRVYEGCARNYLGIVEAANVIKLSRHNPKVSYLLYPDFERSPHPELLASLGVNLQNLSMWQKDYSDTDDPFILHRKEEFVSTDHPMRSKFADLTKEEEQAGLYQDTTTIGTKKRWEEVLEEKGVRLRGHRVVRTKRALGRK